MLLIQSLGAHDVYLWQAFAELSELANTQQTNQEDAVAKLQQ